jgi:GT2 family glycosyltransferase
MSDSAPGRRRVDIGVVTWNSRDLSTECFERLYATDHGVDIRLLVHDNASSDGTAEAIRDRFPQAMLEVAEDNLGFAMGVNRMFARSDAPWFLMLNSDAWLEPGALATMVEAAEQHPRAAAVAPRIESPQGRVEHGVQPFPTPRAAIRLAIPGYARLRPARADELLIPSAWDPARAREVDWAVGAAWLIRRAALEDIGGLDERLFMYGEDLDWCWRAHERGWTIWYEPAALVRHLLNASGEKKFGSQRDTIALRNSYAVARRHQGRTATAVARGAHIAWAARSLLGTLPRSEQSWFWRQYLRSQFRAMRSTAHERTG